ncbi:tetratricopeptide repeat protein [Tautonia rosea]|uniref:tetratricopeptide repeat protein n=1 Tax=Tautonia rosea TaxID=2728037 RepID=UPI0014750BE5|nr:tetratricopeptide repeat protein [Tautonia rosea]
MPTIPVPSRASTSGEPPVPAADPARLRLTDGAILLAFAAVTFLLGVFPLKDVDFWWHLRTGDLIRETGEIPRTDLYTYTVPDRSWIDLHWGFQILLSYGFERGGVVFLNLAKCVITTIAVLLLVTAKRREWPLWVMVLTWLPALVLLGGRMYIRPETLTLLYISIFLAVLFRWDRQPWLGLVLPLTQVCWVNTQGLFVFGPILLTFALIDAALRPNAFGPDRRRWWKIALGVSVLVGLACLMNPYGIRGALFPLTDLLFGTLNDPIFKQEIAELSSIPRLIAESAGYPHFMLIVHLTVVALGGLSFVIPLLWQGTARLGDLRLSPTTPEPAERSRKTKGKKTKASTRRETNRKPAVEPSWSLRPFRLLLYLAFTALSWQATRNSHQFAAIVGTITAWNFGEWAAAVLRRRAEQGKTAIPRLWPRLVTLCVTVGLFATVASGQLYALAEEGRTIGLGEEPAWFPHRAVEFAGSEGLPPRFLGFHIGHDALFIYHHGPERKVFVDPRLEVMGSDQYRAYSKLSRAIATDDPRAPWRPGLEQAGNPVLLADHSLATGVGVSLLLEPSWRCIWFDEVASVFAHEPDARTADLPAVDFLGRHFGTQLDPSPPSRDVEWLSATKGLSKFVLVLLEQRGRPDQASVLIPLGLDLARETRRRMPGAAEPWAFAAALELGRVPGLGVAGADRRYLRPFDPVADLHRARVAAFAREALQRDPDEQIALSALLGLALQGGMTEVAIPLLERSAARPPRSPQQAMSRDASRTQLDRLKTQLGREPRIDVSNGERIRRSVDALLASGRVASAVELLEEQYPLAERDWPTTDRIAALQMHLGYPDRARQSWQAVVDPPNLAIRQARVAATFYAVDDLDTARDAYRQALIEDPELFDAHFGLMLVEFDAGRADLALEAARNALGRAPDDAAKAAVEAIIRRVEPYAGR